MGDQVTAAQQQDALRPLRAFVGAMQGWMGDDQMYAGYDSVVSNPPRQFVIVGPNGVSVEGQPIGTTPSGGLVLSPLLVWLAVGFVAYKLVKG